MVASSGRLIALDADADLRDANGEIVGMLTADDLLIDLVADLGDVVRPITGQVVFGYPEPETAPIPR